MKKNSWDPIWNDVFSSQEWGKYPPESLIQFIARNFYKLVRKDIRILEVGCGTGANIWYLTREGFKVFGIDRSDVAINIAKKRMKDEKLNANLQVGDIVNLPFEDNFFDVVIDIECLYCNTNENANRIYSEIQRVIKPNGKFFSKTFSDKMYIGESQTKIAELEYTNIDNGPFKGKGFVLLSNESSILSGYGNFFTVNSID